MKYLYCVLGVIFFAVLQSTIFADFTVFGIRPLLLLAFAVCAAIIYGEISGGFIGLSCGLAMDFISGDVIGLNGLLFMYVGIAAGLVCKRYLTKRYMVVVGIVFLADLIYEILFYLLRFILWGDKNFFIMLIKVMLPECIYTAIMAVPIMFLIKLVVRLLQPGDEVDL